MQTEYMEEYAKFLAEKKWIQLENRMTGAQFESADQETAENIYLFKMRHTLKSFIFSLGSDDEIKFVQIGDEKNFVKEYKAYIQATGELLPRFIFDEFDAKKFKKCAEFKINNHSILETENYYHREVKNQRNY